MKRKNFGQMMASPSLTNGYYTPSIRKCIASIEDFEINDEVKSLLDISEEEISNLKENNILYLDTRKKEDFED